MYYMSDSMYVYMCICICYYWIYSLNHHIRCFRYCPPPSAALAADTRNGNCSLPNGYGGGHNQYMMANGQVFDSSTMPMMMENHHCDTKVKPYFIF